jgi:membrane protein
MIAPIVKTRIDLRWRDWRRIAPVLWHRLREGRVALIAAGCAFYATLALFPGLSMLVSLYGLMFNPVSVVPQLAALQDVLPKEAFQLIAREVHGLVLRRHTVLQLNVVLSGLVTVWSASTGTKSIMSAIGHTIGGGRGGLLRFQLTGLAMTLCAAFAAVLAIATLVALPHALRFLAPRGLLRTTLHAASVAMLIGFAWASIIALYHFSPQARPAARPPVLPGATLATLAWLGASTLLSDYIEQIVPFDSTYGSLAAVIGVMLWFWVSSFVVLLGAEFNAALVVAPETEKGPEAVAPGPVVVDA